MSIVNLSESQRNIRPGEFVWALGEDDSGLKYYTPEPHQRALHAMLGRAYLRALIAGYGAGKTLFGCTDLASIAWIYPGSRILDVSPSYKQAKRTTIETYVNIFESTFGKQGKYWRFNKTDHEFTFPTRNSLIWIASGDDPRSLKGPNISHARIDEPFIQPVDVYMQVIARLRLATGPLGLVLTGTPEELNWGYDLLFGDKETSDLARKKMTRAVIQASSLENTHNPDTFTDTLFDNYDQLMIQAYVYGQFVSLNTKQAYYQWDANIHIKPWAYQSNLPIYLTFDFNVEPFCANLIQQDGQNDHAFEEIHINTNGNVHRACDEFLAKYKDHKAGIIVSGDVAGQARSVHSPIAGYSLYSVIKEKLGYMPGFRLLLPPPISVINRMNLVNGRLRNSKDEAHLFVAKECRHTIQDFERVKRDADGKIDKKLDPKLTHHSDAVGYYMARFRNGAKISGLSMRDVY